MENWGWEGMLNLDLLNEGVSELNWIKMVILLSIYTPLMKGGLSMEQCPLYYNHSKFFSTEVICEATDEDLTGEQELMEQYCHHHFKKCLRFQTYHDLRIEYLVRKKLKSQYEA